MLRHFFILGKILNDDSLLSDCSIEEDKFLVVMLSKPEGTNAGDSGTTSRLVIL